jgi:hypothetical protein
MKRRIQISQVPEDVYADIGGNPTRVFAFLEELRVEIPPNANFMVLCYKTTRPKLEVRLYADEGDYLVSYTRFMLKDRKDYEFHSFRRTDGEWQMFLPPPVIGLGITTRLRPGVEVS